MPTYAQIQDWIKAEYNFRPKTCWIAHCKEIYGLQRRDAPNRQGAVRTHPCPQSKQPAIEAAFRHFGLLGQEQRL